MALRKYNPKKITGSWKGKIGTREFSIQFEGYMDGTFVQAEYDEDAVTEHVGSDGTVTVVLNANKKATVTITLVQGSPTNDELSKFVPDAARNFLPVGQLNFEDLNGTTKVKSAQSWIRKTSPVEFSNTVTGREWKFGLADAEIVVGGAGDF